jgi:pimeloyl-ACP methyl ester carboxylesterase
MFGDYLDPLTEGGGYRLVLADERACGRSDRTAPRETWTLGRMAQDVSDLAASLGLAGGYATLDHSYGAIVVLQHARHDRAGGHRGGLVAARRGTPRRLGGPLEPPWSSPIRGAGESGAAGLTCARRPRR